MDVTLLAQILDDLRLPFPAWLEMCCHTVLAAMGLGGLVAAARLQTRRDKAVWDEAGVCQG